MIPTRFHFPTRHQLLIVPLCALFFRVPATLWTQWGKFSAPSQIVQVFSTAVTAVVGFGSYHTLAGATTWETAQEPDPAVAGKEVALQIKVTNWIGLVALSYRIESGIPAGFNASNQELINDPDQDGITITGIAPAVGEYPIKLLGYAGPDGDPDGLDVMNTTFHLVVGESSPRSPFADEVQFGAYKWVPWLGWVYDDPFPWVYHYTLGYLYVLGEAQSTLWIYSPVLYGDLGWIWASEDYGYFFYSHGRNNWVEYVQGSANPWQFRDYSLPAGEDLIEID